MRVGCISVAARLLVECASFLLLFFIDQREFDENANIAKTDPFVFDCGKGVGSYGGDVDSL